MMTNLGLFKVSSRLRDGTVIEKMVKLEVDIPRLAQFLGNSALRNKGGCSIEAGGLVIATRIDNVVTV